MLPDKEYLEPEPRLYEDDDTKSTHNSLISLKVKIKGGMVTMIKRGVTEFDGTPIGPYHPN